MSISSDYITGILNESWYDITEEYADLLSDWYGDDLSLLDFDDEDLAAAVRRLARTFRFWRTSPCCLTPYEKLRIEYDALLEEHTLLIEDYQALRSESSRLAWPCRKHVRKKVTLSINRGCGSALERRSARNAHTCAA